MPTDDISLLIQHAPWYSGFELLIGGRDAQGRMRTSTITTTVHEEECVVVEPTMRLTQKQAQKLMDSMWQSGLRPSDGTGSAGQLAATEKHLDDMRDICNRLLRTAMPEIKIQTGEEH